MDGGNAENERNGFLPRHPWRLLQERTFCDTKEKRDTEEEIKIIENL
jgi:hypothetical protein